jgi:hypothetical protein
LGPLMGYSRERHRCATYVPEADAPTFLDRLSSARGRGLSEPRRGLKSRPRTSVRSIPAVSRERALAWED